MKGLGKAIIVSEDNCGSLLSFLNQTTPGTRQASSTVSRSSSTQVVFSQPAAYCFVDNIIVGSYSQLLLYVLSVDFAVKQTGQCTCLAVWELISVAHIAFARQHFLYRNSGHVRSE